MSEISIRFVALFCAALIAGCATTAVVVPAGSVCTSATFQVTDQFAGARRGDCRVTGDNKAMLEIRREDNAVTNPSPWYAFKLVPLEQTTAEIVLDYGPWKHRYWPKISNDGINWSPLDSQYVSVSANKFRATLHVPLVDGAVWVAAQELLTPKIYEVWLSSIADTTDADLRVLGQSRAGLPIYILEASPDAREVIMLTGRQHPPEVSGAFALLSFTTTLLDDTELARAFRERFRILVIPLLNPDGVVGGNWRHNLDGVDLNRDWGPFTQPETRLVGELLDKLDQEGDQLQIFIDFHSTVTNLFYSQLDEDVTDPPNFTRDWLAAAERRLVDYPFSYEPRPSGNSTVSKNYIYGRYGIPAFTYEVGDETDRGAAQSAAVVFAEELMKMLLSQ